MILSSCLSLKESYLLIKLLERVSVLQITDNKIICNCIKKVFIEQLQMPDSVRYWVYGGGKGSSLPEIVSIAR